MRVLAYLLARFSEPSSYAGLGAALALLGWHLSDPVLGGLAQLFAAGCGLLALLLKERGAIPAIILCCAVAPALAGCGGAAAAIGAAAATVGTMTAEAAPLISAGCGAFATAKVAADATVAAGAVSQGTARQVGAVESFGNAACTNPPQGDPAGTAIWLGKLAGQLLTLAAPAK